VPESETGGMLEFMFHLPSILAILLDIGRHGLFFQPSVDGHRLAQHVLQVYLIDWWENAGFGHCPHGRASSVMPHDQSACWKHTH
jgi:hypothetical protein